MRAIWGGGADPVARAPLDGAIEADVVVVGGGVAGLSTALHLAEAGRRVVVLEAGRIGEGATGASAGIIAPQLIRTSPDAVLKRLGRDHGEGMLRLVADSGRALFDLAVRHDIACDATSSGFIAAAVGHSSHTRLSARMAEWQPWRNDIEVLDAAETARLTGCKGYGAAVLDHSGGSIDPLMFAHGLAARVEALGGWIHEASAASTITRHGAAWRVTTDQGQVVAQTVVLAANGGNTALHPALAGTVLPFPVCEVASEPLPAEMRAAILPEGHSLTDLEADIFSIRYAAGGRLVTAFPVNDKLTPTQIVEGVNRRLSEMLRVYRPLRLDYIWQGTAWVNSNLLPRLVRVEDGLVAIQACNGRGLGINALLGRELAQAIVDPARAPVIPFVAPSRVSGFALAKHVPRLLMSAALMTKKLRQMITR